MIASGLLNFHRCCALRLEGKSQVGSILICVSSDELVMSCTIYSRLPTSACSSRHAPCVPCWIALRMICPALLCLLIINCHFIYNGMKACGRCRLASGIQGRVVGLLYGIWLH